MNSRVSSKIQQLLDTLKRPKRPPLTEFFVDDGEGLLEGGRPQRGPGASAGRPGVAGEAGVRPTGSSRWPPDTLGRLPWPRPLACVRPWGQRQASGRGPARCAQVAGFPCSPPLLDRGWCFIKNV